MCNLPVNLMYNLERIQRRAIRVLYKLNFASMVSMSASMRSIGWLKFIYICKHRLLCITHKAYIYTSYFLNIYLNILLFRVITYLVGSATS